MIGARRVVATSGGRLADLARTEGVPVIPVAGGFQPRAAVAYMTVAALEVAALCGAGPRLNSELDVAAEHLEDLVIAWGPEADETCEPKALARALQGTLPVIAGAGLTVPIAYRWKCQINENAKMPAYDVQLPELDHNEIVGWEGAAEHRAHVGRLPRRLRHAPAGPQPPGADPPDHASPRAPARTSWPAAARRPSSASSRWSCSATSCRCTSAVLRGVDPEPGGGHRRG